MFTPVNIFHFLILCNKHLYLPVSCGSLRNCCYVWDLLPNSDCFWNFSMMQRFWNLGFHVGVQHWPHRMYRSTFPLRSGIFSRLLTWVRSRPSLNTLIFSKLEKELPCCSTSLLYSWEFHCRRHWNLAIISFFTVHTLPDNLYF